MKKIFCDKCGILIESYTPNNQLEVKIGIGIGIRDKDTIPQKDLCNNCLKEIKELLRNYFN